MASTIKTEAEQLANSIFLRCSALDLKRTYGNPPDIRQYVAHTENEFRIVAFNSCLQMPKCLTTNEDAANWIINSPELNPLKVVKFLTTLEGRPILAALAANICARGVQNFVERLREFLTISGAVTLISEVQNMPEPLRVVLEEFSSALLQAQPHAMDLTAIVQLCKCVLILNLTIQDRSEASSLPQFFAAVRNISNQSTGLLAPQRLADIYHTLQRHGPIAPSPKTDLFPSFLLTTTVWQFTTIVSFTIPDSYLRTGQGAGRWCVVAQNCLYVYTDKDSPYPSEGVPLGWVRCVISERGEGTCIELQSRGGSNPVVPVIGMHSTAGPSLSYYPGVLLKFTTPAEGEETRGYLERAIWTCTKLVNGS